jgi:hypothetical protein
LTSTVFQPQQGIGVPLADVMAGPVAGLSLLKGITE